MVDGEVDFEQSRTVGQDDAQTRLEQVADAAEVHDGGRLLRQPQLVEFEEQMAVEAVEVRHVGHLKRGPQSSAVDRNRGNLSSRFLSFAACIKSCHFCLIQRWFIDFRQAT